MSFFTKHEARAAATNSRGYRSSKSVLTEAMEGQKERKTFDIFLSHSISDSDLVLGVMVLLQKQGLTVYVDWVIDKQLDRNSVDKKTAAVLRNRMKQSHSMMYIATDNSSSSKWMPWELGFFDAWKSDSVAILPLLDFEDQIFQGQEYLGLYPVVTKHMDGYAMEHFVEDRGSKRSNLKNFARGTPVWEKY